MLSSPIRGGSRQMLSARSDAGVSRASVLPPIQGSKLLSKSASKDTSEVINCKYSTDIQMMMQIRHEMECLINYSTKIINDNEATPDIQTTLSPIIANLSRAFDAFYRNAMNYFTRHLKMSQSAKTNQVLSNASCRIPIQNLKIEWQQTCKIIDIYTESHPPPHAEEIKTKFQAIQSAFATIQQSNDKKKTPNQQLSKTIGSIKLLCDNLSQNINNLFHQQAFPHFEADLLKGYSNDVLSFKKVIIDTFSNDFLQAGISTPVLMRLKANFVADCSSIIDSLKSAFNFPDQMAEIHKTKESLIKLFEVVFEKLSVPFAVIKPKVVADTTQRAPPPPSLAEIAQMEAAAEERKRANDYDCLTNAVQSFIKAMMPYIGSIDLENYLPTTLLGIIPNVQGAFDNVKDQNEKLEKQREQMKEDIVVYSQKKNILEGKIATLTKTLDDKLKECTDLRIQCAEAVRNEEGLKKKVEELEQKIRNLTLFGNPETLRMKVSRHIQDTNVLINNEILKFDALDDSKIIAELENTFDKVNELNNNLHQKEQENARMTDFINKIKSSISCESNNLEEIYKEFEEFNINKDIEIKELNTKNDEIHKSLINFAYYTNSEKPEDSEDVLELIRAQFDKQKVENSNKVESHMRYVQSMDTRLRNIIGSMCMLLDNEGKEKMNEIPTGTEESVTKLNIVIQDQIKKLGEAIRIINENIVESNKRVETYETKDRLIEETLARELNIQENNSNSDLILDVINKRKEIKQGHQKELDLMDSKIIDVDLQIRIIYRRLSAILQKVPNAEETKDMLDSITEMLNSIQDIIDKCDLKNNNILSDNNVQRQCLERLYVQLRKEASQIDSFLGDEIDINEATSEVLCEKVKFFVDIVTSPSYSDNYISREDLKKIFAPILDINKDESEHSNDFIYQFVSEYRNMDQSIKAMMDISKIINTTKKFIEANGNGPSISTLPSVFENNKNVLNTKIQNIKYPSLINMFYRFTSIIDYLISISPLSNGSMLE